jgi:hypothetical protein
MGEGMKSRVDSGVSETIGFIIIFGIVLTGISIVALYGYPALVQEQANANIKNMEKNMLVLQSDLRSLTFKSVPYQETAMQVSGGTLMIKKDIPDSPNFTFNVAAAGGPEHFTPGELRFVSSDGQATVTLENGAVHIRYWSSPNGSAMLATPGWYYDPILDTYVIQLIRINGTADLAQTGIGTVRMQLIPLPYQTNDTVTSSDYIEYNPNLASHYGVAWNNYLRNPDLQLTESSGRFHFKDGSQLIRKYYNVTFLSL